jgi:cathepsin L
MRTQGSVLTIAGLLAGILLLSGCVGRHHPKIGFDYAARERKASPEIKERLAKLRETIKSQGLGFEVGYTTAMDRPLKDLAGTRVPQDFATSAPEQNRIGLEMLKLDLAARDRFILDNPGKLILPRVCQTSLSSWDYRSVGRVTPVRHQLGCGSCWDFAASGGFEASMVAINPPTADIAEQQILDCSGAGSCSGGWHEGVFNHLITHGVGDESADPYAAASGTCSRFLASPHRAAEWAYVTTEVDPGFGWARVPTVDEIKEALCQHGPLTAAVLVTDLFQAYNSTSTVFRENLADNVLHPIDAPSGLKLYGINHDVLIIGWSDKNHAWLIKNSWGPGWGGNGDRGTTNGYMWIDYNTNNIGFGAAWVRARSPQYQLPARYFELQREIRIPQPEPGPENISG